MKRKALKVGMVVAEKTGKRWEWIPPDLTDHKRCYRYRAVAILELQPYKAHTDRWGRQFKIEKVSKGGGVLVQPCTEDGQTLLGKGPHVAQLGSLLGPYDEVHAEQEALIDRIEEIVEEMEADRKTKRAVHRRKLDVIKQVLPGAHERYFSPEGSVVLDIDALLAFLGKHGHVDVDIEALERYEEEEEDDEAQ